MKKLTALVKTTRVGMLALLTGAVLLVAHAETAEYPSKPIRILVPFAVGQGADLIARSLIQSIMESGGQPVIVDDRPGANGIIATQIVATAAPDGYTVLLTTNTTHAANASLFKKLPYDPVKDFTAVTLLNKGPLVFVVPNESPYKTAAEFLAAARANPDKLTFGAASSSTRMSGELFQQLAGTKVRYVPYKGTPQALTDLMGNQVDFAVADIPSAQPLILQGKMRALAVTSLARHQTLKNVPTWNEAGLQGYEFEAWVAVFVPSATPRPVVDKLNVLFRKALDSKSAREYYERAGLVASPTTPNEMTAFAAGETEKWARIVRAAGIEAE